MDKENECRRKFEEIVGQAFPGKEIESLELDSEIEYEEEHINCRLRVKEPGPPSRHIIILPTDELMKNEEETIVNICKESFGEAIKLLSCIPQKPFLGNLILTTKGGEFEKPPKNM